MKRGLFSKWTLKLALSVVLTGGFAPARVARALELSAATTSDSSAPAPVFIQADPGTDDPANAPATVVSSDIAVPANLHLTPNATEVLKMANSGVDQSVMLSYVNNSAGTFNLGADEIIYLKDIGVPAEVVDAMLQRDQTLTGQPAAITLPTAPAPTPAPPLAPEPQTVAPVEAPLTPPPAAEPAFSTFYNALTPYGTWVDVAGYGRCWQPAVVVADPNWSPYWDGGHWVYTDAAWYWYSDYSWGWAPFHYGRWFRHASLGWCWAPDTVWGPAWVSWRHTDDYCGWAPLAPGVFFSVGFGLTFGEHCWHDWDRPWNHHFVAWRDFGDRDLHHHGLERHEVNQIFNRTIVDNRVIVHNHVTINEGIPRERVAAATRTDIRPVALHETRNVRQLGGRAEQLDPAGRRLTVYRPPMAGSHLGVAPERGRLSEPTLPQHRVSSQPAPPQTWPPARTTALSPATPNAYQSSGRTATLTASHSATGQLRTRVPSVTPSLSASAATRPAGPNYSAAVPRYGAPVATMTSPRYTAPSYTANPQYSSGSYQVPARSLPEVTQSNPSFTPPRSYASAARPAIESPRYNPPTYVPPRSYASPVFNHSWAPSPSPHYSAPAVSGFPHDSSPAASPAHSAPPSSSPHGSEYHPGHR